MNDNLKIKLQLIPEDPGCYQMRDANNKIIYVGKAKNLKRRVNQYFVGSHDYKTTKLVSKIHDFTYIITSSEKEALLLEINLIKKYNPRFNIVFMDDKSYPYIKLLKEPYPYLSVTRDIKKDKKAKYFGPYPDVLKARNTVDLLNTIYPTRKCKNIPKKACLYYHLHQCLGPCIQKVDENEINKIYKNIVNFLNGDIDEIINELNDKMLEASSTLNFEKAQEYHELITSIEETISKQTMEVTNIRNADIFNYYLDKDYLSIQVLMIRNYKLLNVDLSLNPLYGDYSEEFISFIVQYYKNHVEPKEIILPSEFEGSILDTIFNNITYPKRGNKLKLIEIAYTNAKNHHDNMFETVYKKNSNVDEAMDELSNILHKPITTIEIFDNSHISGTDNVSGMVVFENGVPNKNKYRRYKLQDMDDDYKSMYEVLYRRYFRLLKDDLEFPDLIIVDGGKGQINICKEVLSALDIDIEVVGLVKDDKHNTSMLMNKNLETIPIDKQSPLFFMLTRMQDEVHRYAISYHRLLRDKHMQESILDDIENVGPKTKEKLLKHFKNINNIKKASEEELNEVVNKNAAHSIFIFFSNN